MRSRRGKPARTGRAGRDFQASVQGVARYAVPGAR